MMRNLLIAMALIGSTALSAAEKPEQENIAKAYFAGGCFWCSEADFEKVDGVIEAISGYMGGHTKNPSYKQVTSGRTGHAELVEVQYNPEKIGYEQLLTHFWYSIDPLTANAQFCDKGSQYRSAIFVNNASERAAAEASKAAIEKELGKKVVTEINPLGPFTVAEDYHQDYYKKNPVRYNYYRFACGRDDRLETIWGDKAGK